MYNPWKLKNVECLIKWRVVNLPCWESNVDLRFKGFFGEND
jgi:hypothetical protein